MLLNLQNQYLMSVLFPLRMKLFSRAWYVLVYISDHSLIYATRKLNSVFERVSRNSVEFRNFKKFYVERFLNDLYTLPWVELNNKQNVQMLENLIYSSAWQTFAMNSKKNKEKEKFPWFKKAVKNKLFKRDHFKHNINIIT